MKDWRAYVDYAFNTQVIASDFEIQTTLYNAL